MKIRNEKLSFIWSGTPAIWAIGAAIGALMSLQSCSLRDREVKYGVSIQMPNQNIVQQMMTNANITEPTSMTTVQCIGLNIMGDGIPGETRFGCSDPQTMGMMIGTVPISGGRLEAMVPAGAGRRIQLIGANSSLGYCPSFDEMAQRKLINPNEEVLGKPYLLGEAVTDVFGDVSVRINPVFDSSKIAFQSCEGGGGSGSYQPELTFRSVNQSLKIQKQQCVDISIEARVSDTTGLNSLSVSAQFVSPSPSPSPSSVGLFTDPNCNTPYAGAFSVFPVNNGVQQRQVQLFVKTGPTPSVSSFDLKVNTTAIGWTTNPSTFTIVDHRLDVVPVPSPVPLLGAGDNCVVIVVDRKNVASGSVGFAVNDVLAIRAFNNTPGSSGAPSTRLYTNPTSCLNDSNDASLLTNTVEDKSKVWSYTVTTPGTQSFYIRSNVAEDVFFGFSSNGADQPFGFPFSWLPFSPAAFTAPVVSLSGNGQALTAAVSRGASNISQVLVDGVPCTGLTSTASTVSCVLPAMASFGVKNIELKAMVGSELRTYGSGSAVTYLNFQSGDGSSSAPFEIVNVDQLLFIQIMSSPPYNIPPSGRYFRQTAALDFTGLNPSGLAYFSNDLGIVYDGVNNVIANLDAPLFSACSSGAFQFRNVNFSSVQISDSSSANVGTVCGVMSAGLIENIFINNASLITSSSGSAANVGSIVGQLLTGGTLVNVKSSASVNGPSMGGMIGGIAGYSAGQITRGVFTGAANAYATNSGVLGGIVGRQASPGSLIECAVYDTANMLYMTGSGTSIAVGGLVGEMAGGAIQRSLNRKNLGSAMGASGGVGGLVGKLDTGSIDDSYSYVTSISSSTSGATVGGLVGIAGSGGSVNRVYAMVTISMDGSTKGGLFGSDAGLVENSAYSNSVSGANTSYGTNLASGYDNPSSYGGFVFSGGGGPWRMPTNTSVGNIANTPVLAWTCGNTAITPACY